MAHKFCEELTHAGPSAVPKPVTLLTGTLVGPQGIHTEMVTVAIIQTTFIHI